MNKQITIGIFITILLIAGAVYTVIFNGNKNITEDINQKMTNEKDGKADVIEYAQITGMRLNAGEQTFEAFRILRNGMAEWARWNSSGHLLNHGEPRNIGSENFNKVALSRYFLNPPKVARNNGALGRPAFKLDIAIFTKSGSRNVSMAKMPDDIAALTDEIKRSVKETSIQPGWYIWTQPYPRTGKPDIDLTDGGRDSAIAAALSEAAATSSLITRADDSIRKFISGENAYRTAFEAKLEKGNMLFGVLNAK